ncbi:response regulator transcription factor [Chitinophaga sp. GCM10012297]|uniref:Response regulator transcription factor n=1 Tax=Chitinophaga chungangae TaxID=2821488 RepID=A0ABS3YBA8_9BACT|nr:response regulator transcription factor [Chitinophaga chungangae]MBO9151628.1 response regulator transcription factor [Chitinophaga chungangae]
MKLLVIEDETDLAKSITGYLADYACETAATYAEALEKVETYEYDCILLDIMLPGGDGIKILEAFKALNRQDGVIIISARNSLDDKVKGLKTGADDYLAKPFHLSELAARIHSVIRRKNFSNTDVIVQQELKVDLLSKKVTVHGYEIPLTKSEFDLLLYLMGNKNRVISKSALAEHLSGDIADMLDSHSFVYAHIKNLRKKLGEAGYGNYLKNVYGTGYRWED